MVDCPGATLAVVVEPEAMPSAKSWPVPLKLTVCVLPVELLLLSVMLKLPVKAPPASGVKLTLIVQEPLAGTVLPQLFVCAKFPLVAMLATVSARLPVLESVTACEPVVEFTGRAAKVSVVGERPASGAVPVPVRLTVCVLLAMPLLLSVTVIVPVRVPAAVGVNVMLIVQLPPAATELPQVFVCAKSPAFVSVIAMLVMLKAPLPELLRVTGCTAPVVPRGWLPKVKTVAVRLATGLVPVPVRVTDCVLPVTPLLLSVIVSVPLRVPFVVGVNVTLIVQLELDARLLPQVLPWEKSPLAVMLAMVSGAVPVLLSVNGCDELGVPTF